MYQHKTFLLICWLFVPQCTALFEGYIFVVFILASHSIVHKHMVQYAATCTHYISGSVYHSVF